MKMGETRVKVKVTGPRASEDVVMLVDTGATLTTLPEQTAKELGVVVDEVVSARLADGTVRQFGMGEVKMELRV